MTATVPASDSASAWSCVTSSALVPAARRMPRHLLAQRVAQPGVERRERLVEQHDLGVGGQGAGERDALALAARQLVRVVAGPVGQADELEALLRRARAGRRRSRRCRRRSGAGTARRPGRPSRSAGARAPPTRRRPPRAGRRSPRGRRRAASKPAITRSSVVLPEPLGPSSATSSPEGTRRLAPATARVRPNAFSTPSASIARSDSGTSG